MVFYYTFLDDFILGRNICLFRGSFENFEICQTISVSNSYLARKIICYRFRKVVFFRNFQKFRNFETSCIVFLGAGAHLVGQLICVSNFKRNSEATWCVLNGPCIQRSVSLSIDTYVRPKRFRHADGGECYFLDYRLPFIRQNG